MLPVEAYGAGLCLDGWLSHDHKNPGRCIAMEQDAQSAAFMMARSTLRPRRWTTPRSSRGEVIAATVMPGVRRADLRLHIGSNLSA